MTKKELLEILSNSEIADDKSKRIVERVRDTLDPFDEKTELGDLRSVEDFKNNGGFRRSRLNEKASDVSDDLRVILIQVQDRIKHKVQTGEVYAAEAAKQNIMRKHSVIVRLIFGTVIIAAALAAIILTCLRIYFKKEFCEWIPEIIGCADFVIGIVFFIYESASDRKKAEEYKNAGKALENGKIDNYIEACNTYIDASENKKWWQFGILNIHTENNTEKNYYNRKNK